VASTTAHFIVGAALSLPALKCRPVTAVLTGVLGSLPNWTIPVAAGLLATTPDFDLAMRRLFGYRASSMFSHRGFFHSPFFLILLAAALAGIITRLGSRRTFARQTFAWLWLFCAGCLLTHPLLDTMTDGGYGVMLFAPFKHARLYLPWRPIHTPPRTETLFRKAWVLRRSEAQFCVAAILIGISGWWVLRPFGKAPSAS
jgi:inner membrane protein